MTAQTASRGGDDVLGPSGRDQSVAAGGDLAARTFRRSLLALLLAGVLALVAMVAVTAWLTLRSQDLTRWIDHTYKVESDLAKLDALIERAEAVRRGYLLAPAEQFRSRYLATEDQVGAQIDLLAVETFDNAVQRQTVVDLRRLENLRTKRVSMMMAYAAAGDIRAAVRSFVEERDLPVLQMIRADVSRMQDEETRLLKMRTQQEVNTTSSLFAAALVGGGLMTILSLGAAVLMRRYAQDLDRAQSALRRLNAELEIRVRDRTQDLSRANEEIQRFAYIVSHDLRSPLVNVMGFTSELEISLAALRPAVEDDGVPQPWRKAAREAVDQDIPEAIGFIRASTQKMDRLINAILRLSREGRRTLAPEPLAMDGLVGGLIDGVRHRLIEQGAQACVVGSLPDLMSDRLAVEQVFGNLLDNAVKYLSANRPGMITISGRTEGSMRLYEVADNGRGVAPSDHERIFELFRRSGAQDQKGEGIGLAHVRALVHRLGGTITCDSDLDRGACFKLKLPHTLSQTGS